MLLDISRISAHPIRLIFCIACAAGRKHPVLSTIAHPCCCIASGIHRPILTLAISRYRGASDKGSLSKRHPFWRIGDTPDASLVVLSILSCFIWYSYAKDVAGGGNDIPSQTGLPNVRLLHLLYSQPYPSSSPQLGRYPTGKSNSHHANLLRTKSPSPKHEAVANSPTEGGKSYFVFCAGIGMCAVLTSFAFQITAG